MQFEDVLSYLEQLIGKELLPLNDSNGPLLILEVDSEKKRYTIEKTKNTKKRTRPFSELQKIWELISQKGYVSVDHALNGSGSSRHQPETIFANFPCIEHFKYDGRKHLYLRSESTHLLASLKSLTIAESREIKKRIDKYRDFDISQFHKLHSKQVNSLKNNLENVFTKFPGESDVDSIKAILNEIQELDFKLSEAVVNVDNTSFSKSEDENEGEDEGVKDSDTSDDNDDYISGFSPSNDTQGLKKTRISQVTPTVSLLYDRVNYKEIDLQPEFQRGDRIWPVKDKARLIESILLGLPLPVFYFAERQNSDLEADADFDWVVIDGLQRITALVGFMKGDFVLKDLKQLKNFNGLAYKDLPRKELRRIREYQIHGHLIQISQDSDEMIRELFHRINTYGKNLSFQEIRSALYPGTANRFFKYFAESNDFIDAIPAKINPDRMLDIEYVLRAVSFLIFGYEKYEYSTADEFLSHTMYVLNEYKFVVGKMKEADSIYKNIDFRLKASCKTITKIFGDSAYKKDENGKINKTLFELLLSVFSLMSDKERNIIEKPINAEELKSKFFEMIEKDKQSSVWVSDTYKDQNRGFEYSISNSTSKKVTVLYRFRSLVSLINEVTDMEFKPQPLLEDKNKFKGL